MEILSCVFAADVVLAVGGGRVLICSIAASPLEWDRAQR
jgi:hypothetical protein